MLTKLFRRWYVPRAEYDQMERWLNHTIETQSQLSVCYEKLIDGYERYSDLYWTLLRRVESIDGVKHD